MQSTILEIDASLDALQAEAEQQYREHVIALAEGRQVAPALLRDAMNHAGRSRADLKRHLRIARERKAAVESLGQVAEISASLDGLKLASDAARADVDQAEAEHRERVRPLRAAAFAAAAAFTDARRKVQTLHHESNQTLGASTSSEALHELGQLSNRRVNLEQRLHGLKAVAPDRTREFAEVETHIKELRAIVAHQQKFAAGPGVSATTKHHVELNHAEERRRELLRFNNDLLNTEVEYREAGEALDAFEGGALRDWRRMRFD